MRSKKTEKKSPFANSYSPVATKSLGQNFLVDQNDVDKIISALDVQKDETIIEIGAGRGALTEKLVEKAGNVVAIEFDKDLILLLQAKFEEYENFILIEQDALKIDFKKILASYNLPLKTKLVANLPYYISTAILQKLITQRECFSELVLMLQKEVVERITADKGNKQRGFLTVLVEAYMKTEKLFEVSPDAFRPVPKVWSSVMRLITKEEKEIGINDEKLFREIVSAGFSQKRKTILNNLKNAPVQLQEKLGDVNTINKVLENSKIETQRRAETLSLIEWKKLCGF